MPPPPETESVAPPLPPAALRPVVAFLLVNLALSILLTVAVFATKNSIINFQLDSRHITDPAERRFLRQTYADGIWFRVLGNVVASVVYVFLVRALLRGRRWAYRRVIFLGVAGILALAALWSQPYPPWVRVEQIVQSLVLAALVYFVTRPAVREHFRTAPGAAIGRFRHS
jgi:peptidoglycan/LPS O-acetylase OafA/YrhL